MKQNWTFELLDNPRAQALIEAQNIYDPFPSCHLIPWSTQAMFDIQIMGFVGQQLSRVNAW